MLTPKLLGVKSVQIQVDRYGVGSWDGNGEWTDGLISTVYIKANIQPNLSGNMMRMLPEGDRSKQAIAIYSVEPLIMAEEGLQAKKADVVYWSGYKWQVKAVMTYAMGILNHSESVAVRLDSV